MRKHSKIKYFIYNGLNQVLTKLVSCFHEYYLSQLNFPHNNLGYVLFACEYYIFTMSIVKVN